MAIAAQAYFLSGGEASLEYGQNPGSNPQLKALADLVEDPQNPSAGDPAMALRTIQHKTSQVKAKSQEYLNDPAASFQDKVTIQQLTQQINNQYIDNYQERILAIKNSADRDRYIKLPPLKNTESGMETLAPVAKALLNTEPTDVNGTVVVKTTVRNGERIEEKAGEQRRNLSRENLVAARCADCTMLSCPACPLCPVFSDPSALSVSAVPAFCFPMRQSRFP